MNNESKTNKLTLVRDTLATMNDSDLDQVRGGDGGTDLLRMGVDVLTATIPATVEIWKEIRKPRPPKDPKPRDPNLSMG